MYYAGKKAETELVVVLSRQFKVLHTVDKEAAVSQKPR